MNGLQWIEKQKGEALNLLKKWANINSWSHNANGLNQMAAEIKKVFAPLADTSSNLSFLKRKEAPKRILLGGHMDTVYPPESPFQTCQEMGSRLIGPGVADMKGGLVVLWLALLAFEKFSDSKTFGWEVFINPDEEIGSPHSRREWEEKGKNACMGLLFEPSFSDGALVDRRKGSSSFKISIQGTPAHAGRDFEKGRSAILAISVFITEAYKTAKELEEVTINAGELVAHSPLNVIAEKASCSLNIRSFKTDKLHQMKEKLEKLAHKIEKETETSINLLVTVTKEPKIFTEETKKIFHELQQCANELNNTLTLRESGGLSDGNILSAVNLPCIDTLGVIGGHLHTADEYMEIDSMIERAKLVYLFLCRYSKKGL